MKNENYSGLKKFCTGLGLDLFGVAETAVIRRSFALAAETAQKFPYAVCVGARLARAVLDDVPDHPTRPYFHHYKTANVFLDQCGYRISAWIEKKGSLAFPVAASQILDWEKQTGLLSHKHIARLAGLGWIGRNNLLVNKKLGAGVRLATVLTDLPLAADKPVKDSCGECRRCMALCPAGAIKERPEDFDHQGCFAKLKEFQKLRYTDQYICGVCIKACAGSRR